MLFRSPNVPYGSVGNGSSQHLAGAYFEQIAGVHRVVTDERAAGDAVDDAPPAQEEKA